MKKWLKIFIRIFSVVIACFAIDFICIFLLKRPIFAVKEKNTSTYRGLFYDTYICEEFSTPQIKGKGNKFSCSQEKNHDEFAIKTKENCDTKRTKYYTDALSNRTIYLSCIEDAYLREKPLKDALQNTEQTFEDNIQQIMDSMNFVDIYKDGGSKLYKKNNYAILLCNTIDGNQDIYIGNSNLTYENSFCK